MNSDLEIVMELLTALNSNDNSKSAHLVAPDVEIVDPFLSNVTFEEYTEHMALMANYVEAKITSIEEIEGIFHMSMSFTILDTTSGFASTFPVDWAYTIRGGLLVKSEITMDISKRDFEYLSKIKKQHG